MGNSAQKLTWKLVKGIGHRFLGGIGVAMAGIGLDASIAKAAPLLQEVGDGATQQLWPVLLPLATAAIGVERAVEIVWNYIEWTLLSTKRWDVADLKSARYTEFKSGTSLLLGVIMGILVSNYTGMRLFDYLRPIVPTFLDGVPALWDVIITGVIIGAGAKPAHDILGIITQFKNFLGNSAIHQRESAANALAEGVLKLAQSEAQSMVEVPGIGPARISAQAATRGMPSEPGDAAAPESETKRYVETLRRHTAY